MRRRAVHRGSGRRGGVAVSRTGTAGRHCRLPRVGLVRRTRFGTTCQEAVAKVFAALPESAAKRLFSVDAGIATVARFREATEQDALVGRLRKNVALRRAPHPRRPGRRGRPARHGPMLHPGAKRPEGRADEDTTIRVEERAVRVRRWRHLHFRETPQTHIEVVRVDDRRTNGLC